MREVDRRQADPKPNTTPKQKTMRNIDY